MRFIFLFILLLPVAEIWCLIEVGSRIGVLPTLGLLLAGAVLGTQLLKQQGMSTLLRINERLAAGELPAQEIVRGLLTALAGVLFIIPGFISDVLALLCLFPLTRYLLVRQILTHPGYIQVRTMNFGAGPHTRDEGAANVYEGEYRRESARESDRESDREPRLPPSA